MVRVVHKDIGLSMPKQEQALWNSMEKVSHFFFLYKSNKLEKIDEEPEKFNKLYATKSDNFITYIPLKKEISSESDRDFQNNEIIALNSKRLTISKAFIVDERKNNSLIDDMLITMNSKKKLNISTWEFLGIMCCIHKCSKILKKKNDLYDQSVLKLQNMLNSNYMMEKLYEVEKLKYLLFNNDQNYAFSFLTKPLIVFTDEGKTFVQNDIIKSREEFKEEKTSKEDSIKFLFKNNFDCSHINEKLLKLIKVNNC